jgi:hypothetical protein
MSLETILISPAKQPAVPQVGSKILFLDMHRILLNADFWKEYCDYYRDDVLITIIAPVKINGCGFIFG